MLTVVHISSSKKGGAGRAAFRIYEAMLGNPEISSFFISGDDDEIPVTSGEIRVGKEIKKERPLFEKFKSKLGLSKSVDQENYHLLEGLKGDYEIFSLPRTDFRVEDLQILMEADIIHLHWVANFVNYRRFFDHLKHKKFVWTFHDMNPFMGGFHYRNDYINNPSFHELERRLIRQKASAVHKIKNLSVVTPSRWLLKNAQKSNYFKADTTFTPIPYSLDLEIFKPTDKKEAKQKLHIEPNLPCLLIVAQDLKNNRKGFDLLRNALGAIPNNLYQLLTVGDNTASFKGENVIDLGVIDNDRSLALAYSAADLFILPSIEDNLPNVMLEAFACGTPVLSFKVGGMKEWITPGINGFFAESFNSEGLKNSVFEFLCNAAPYNSSQIRKIAITNFSPIAQGEKYRNLYHSILTSG